MPAPRPLPPQLLRQPFRLRDAVRLGVSDDVLRGRRFRRVFRGVYVCRDVQDSTELVADAARLLVPPTAVFSHQTAAQLRGLPVPDDGRIHLTVPPGSGRTRVAGLAVHQAGLWCPPASYRGRPVTAPECMFVELAAMLPLADLVILGDAMVRRRWTTVERLRAAAERIRTRGFARSGRAAELVRDRVDSPMETRVRLLAVLAGLPCPEPGREVHDADGQWIATVDLQYAVVQVIIEYDGDLHRTSRRKWRNDSYAREQLRRLGWHVIVLTADDVIRRPLETVERIRDALLDRGHPGVPPCLNPAWREAVPPTPTRSSATFRAPRALVVPGK